MATLVDGKLTVGCLCLVASFALFLSACDGPPAPVAATPASRPAEVPPAGVLALAIPDDMKNAALFASDLSVQQAVNDYLANPGRRWTLNAARPIGDYVLLWIGFPGIADGGVDLIYSKKEQRVRWVFKGGERG